MKRLKYILFLSLCCSSTVAQEAWTIDRCIAYSVQHSTPLHRQRIENIQRTANERAAKQAFLPTIAAQMSGQYSWGRNINPETNTYNTITTFNNYYNIGAELTLFDGGRLLNSLRQARLIRSNNETLLAKLAEEKAIVIMNKFVEAIYNRKSVNLAERKLSDSKALLYKTQRLYELGEKARPDVVQMESQVAEDEFALLHQQNEARTTLLALKTEMNYPLSDTLVLDTCTVLLSDEKPTLGSLYNRFSTASPKVRNAEFEVKNARYNYLIQRTSRLPRLTLSVGISTNYFKSFNQGGYQGSGFFKQLSNNMGEYVAVSLSIPIFNPSTKNNIRKAETNWHLAQLALEETRQKVEANIAQALIDYDNCIQEIAQMNRKVAADSVAYHLSFRKYEEGMLSTFDLQTSGQKLLTSRIHLLKLQMLAMIKQRILNYYKGDALWTSK